MAHSEWTTSEPPPGAMAPAAAQPPDSAPSSASATALATDETTRTAPAAVPLVAPAPPSVEPVGERVRSESAAAPGGALATATAGGANPPRPPEPEALTHGPGKPVLAGAAIVGAILVTLPMLLVAAKSERSVEQPAPRPSVADAAVAVLLDDSEGRKPVRYVPFAPSPSAVVKPPEKSTAPPPAKGQDKAEKAPPAKKPPASGAKTAPAPEPAPKPALEKLRMEQNQALAPVAVGNGDNASYLAGSKLCVGQTWRSLDGRTELRMQTDRNFVLYRDGRALWAAPGALGRGKCAELQTDGNLVLLDANRNVIWAANFWGRPTYLAVQNDGNLVLYTADHAPVWATNTRQ